ncbi:uncharacterized protein LOC112234842 [Oncorhynchus tshawytscha]|uniref:uncharacterized protein LOC112234842 n=1 Tax=Oncorhynchus tshawytscha TaxID=74940 RepID=UPI001C3D63FB|nr:uncharacterized protein LOC112234842 [Oncorhynchus tshawytscha]
MLGVGFCHLLPAPRPHPDPWVDSQQCWGPGGRRDEGLLTEESIRQRQRGCHGPDHCCIWLTTGGNYRSTRGGDGTVCLRSDVHPGPLCCCSIPPSLHLFSLTVTFHGPSPPPLPSRHHGNRVTGSVTSTESQESAPHPLPQVCGDVVIIRGQFYWEVDVCNSTLYRIGVSSLDDACGWWLERQGLSFSTVYDSCREPLRAVPPQIKTLGLFLNMGGGTLSFHNPLTQEHLATLPTRFSHAGVRPALGLGQGRLRLHCGLPPPPHVFLSRASDYRGPTGAGGGRWRRDMPFRSVRMVIQKFEELAVSDSDSGLVSSFGSSCSTLAEPGPGLSFSLSPGAALHSGKERKEAGAE